MEGYEYSGEKHRKGQSVDQGALFEEARSLPFFEDLLDLQLAGNSFTFRFNRKLTSSEKKKLDALVAAHDPAKSTASGQHGVRARELPAGSYEGERSFCADGRKKGEEKGRGTGVPVYWSHGEWRRYSDDEPVSA
jgi:hypothetical protein